MPLLPGRLKGWFCNWNEAAEKVFAYTSAEAVGRHLNELICAFRSHRGGAEDT